MVDLFSVLEELFGQNLPGFITGVLATLFTNAVSWCTAWLRSRAVGGNSHPGSCGEVKGERLLQLDSMRLFEKCKARIDLRDFAFRDAGICRNKAVYQVCCAVVLALSSLCFALLAAYANKEGEPIAFILSVAATMFLYLWSYLFLFSMLLGADSPKDVLRVLRELKYKRLSKERKRFLGFQSIESVMRNYSHCLVINAGG